jgi:hypothetical protein
MADLGGSDVTARRAPLGYRAALQWMLDNDDVYFLDDDDPAISVTGAIVADIYDRTNDEVIADLRRMRAKAVLT